MGPDTDVRNPEKILNSHLDRRAWPKQAMRHEVELPIEQACGI
jgi:hypothetical protein